MRMPPLPADFIHARACKLKCEKILTRPLSRLEPQERQAIVLYLDGKRPVRRAEKCSFQTALDKLRDYYLAVQYVPQANQ